MNEKLTQAQARVLGSLIEKELTTPDYYPLSLHALTAACNQKSNREPVMSLSEPEVQQALDALVTRNLAAQRGEFGARVPKYAHRLAGTLTRTVDFSRAELAVVAELLLRGAQTPGELRARAARMHPYADLGALMAVLAALAQRQEPVVVELPRQAGRREARYACTWLELPAEEAAAVPVAAAPDDREARLRALEQQVAALAAAVRALQARLGDAAVADDG